MEVGYRGNGRGLGKELIIGDKGGCEVWWTA